jgi:hypothetical protein
MPQNRLDTAIKTLNLNADVKAQNTQIMVCSKSNSKKIWTATPTSAHVTDPCESMLNTEWKAASHWIPYRVSKWRWLVQHHMEKQRFSFNDWSDEDESDENEDNNSGDEEKDASATKFGPIPRFSRSYSVQVNTVANVFECSCCHQERMGMPCRHIASVCLSNEAILGKEPKGFPLSSIKIFWWNKYYLYGTSQYDDHLPIKNALIALANNDTHGLPCPTQLDDPITYNCPEHILRASITPASDRLLNYDSQLRLTADEG